MKKLIAGNWKMNGSMEGALGLAKDIVAGIQEMPALLENNDFLVCPPYLHLAPVQTELTSAISLGGQDCSPFDKGAYTGDVSAAMLKDMNCSYVILGHSERRQYYAESNLMIKQKAQMAQDMDLVSIICVGETELEREEGREQEVVGEQLVNSLPEGASAANVVIAYEPVWAIGTGKVATIEDISTMHAYIRGVLAENAKEGAGVRILYGGSVKPTNAAEIFAVANVNGALIGGASLQAHDFLGIAAA